MATLRERPYVQFNFLIDLGTGTTDGFQAGFQECSNIGMEVTVAEYRTGNFKENSVQKITGLNKSTDVTLKRGVIGSLNLYAWLNDIRNGNQRPPILIDPCISSRAASASGVPGAIAARK